MSVNSRSSLKLIKSDSLDSSTSDFFKNFKELFKESFITNCHLDDASVTVEELETLDELDYREILENLKDLISSLLAFKSNARNEGTGEVATRCEQLEKLLQKQESEVRAHIRNEHQLKLHIDSIQQKALDLEGKYQEAQSNIKELESRGNESMQTKLKKLENRFQNELKEISEQYHRDSDSRQSSEKCSKFEEMYNKKEKSYLKLQQDFQKIKGLLEETTKQCKALKKQIEKHGVVALSNDALTKRKEDSVERPLSRSYITSKSSIQDRSKRHIKKKSEDITFHHRYNEPIPPQNVRSSTIVKSSNHHNYHF